MILRGNVYSKMLEMDTGLSVYLSGSIRPEHGPYKIIYLLHGMSGDSNSWLDRTMLSVYGKDYPAVFVMPEVARSFYTDMIYGQRFLSYVTKELPEICHSVFHLSARREDSMVMGGSMGGYGALKCALTAPEQYGACCALASGPLYLDQLLPELREEETRRRWTDQWGGQMIPDLKAALGAELPWIPETDPLELAKKLPVADAPRFYAACGLEDDLLGLNRPFAKAMKKLGFDYTYEEFHGRHDWYFFNEGLKKALDFCWGR